MTSFPPDTPPNTDRILESITDAFMALDSDWRFTYVNDQSARVMGRKREDLLGRSFWDEFPAAVGSTFERKYRRAVDERIAVTFEEFYSPLDIWVEVRAYPSKEGLAVFYRDVTARKRAEEDLRRSQEDLRLAIDAARLGTFYCDYPLDKIVWNDTCKHHFFLPPDAYVDFTLFYSLLHPDDREPTRRAIEQAMEKRVAYDVEYRTSAPDGHTRWVNAVGRFCYDAEGNPTRFDGVTLDISDRRRVQEALRQSEEALRQSEERLRDAQARLEAALEAGGTATWTWDVLNDRVVADSHLARLFSVGPEDAAGGRIETYLQAIHPDDRPRVAEAIADAMARRQDYEAEYRVVLPDGSHRWLATRGRVERDAAGQAVSLPGVVVDITEQAERRRRERFLADLAERARVLTEAEEVIADTVRSVGEFLGVARCIFVDIDLPADSCTIARDYYADGAAVSMAGTFTVSAFGASLAQEYAAGRTVVAEDVRSDLPPDYVSAYDALGVRAFVAVPVVHSARLVSVLSVHSPTPRHWEAEEIELLQAAVERTWLTVEVLRQRSALAREAQEQRARAEREALLNRIGAAIRLAADPERVLEASVRELGQALSADRCYYAAYDQDADTATVGPDWHRDGLPSLAGHYAMSPHAINRDPVYTAGRTQVVADTTGDAATEALGLRALVRVPLVSGRAMTALSVAMADGPRAWTAEDVSLVEAVATQTQTALEAVRVQRRARRIAEQLQDALQPTLPESVAGLSVGKFTQPALAEAEIGGDFFDIFPLDKELYAIVIGDVSGKGLAAAQQLALIRNSLRTTLYLYRAPAQAAAAVNAIVTAHDLLVGFVTAWIGVYDATRGQITYCSCGHEPGLVRRASGSVEALATTGPPLGVAENAGYGELSVTLSSGDALLLYTDGLSEAGPSRREMLGTEGLIRLFGALPVGLDTTMEVQALMNDVSAFTNGDFRDDVAVLLARRL